MAKTDLREAAMVDLLDATIIDLTCDETGKVWVNVDGKCLVRIGKVKHISLYGLIGGDASFHRSFVPGPVPPEARPSEFRHRDDCSLSEIHPDCDCGAPVLGEHVSLSPSKGFWRVPG